MQIDTNSPRYPYTYAWDYLRNTVGPIDDSVLSRAQASGIVHTIVKALSQYYGDIITHEQVAIALSDRFIEEQMRLTNES